MPHQVRRAPGGYLHVPEVFFSGMPFPDGGFGQVGVADDRGEDVVEIVGDTPGEGADGLHFLGLPKLRLQL